MNVQDARQSLTRAGLSVLLVLALALSMTIAMLSAAAGPAMAATQTAGNDIYRVHVSDTDGRFTVTTGPGHPVGGGLNVLFGHGTPGTTYHTIRSYTSDTDYLPAALTFASSPNTRVAVDDFLTSFEAIGTTGFRVTFTITSPDTLTIEQVVNVHGSTFDDSRVEVTTTITNDDNDAIDVGVRYLWDTQIGVDDGPTFQTVDPDGPVLFTEAEFAEPNFTAFRVEDNDGNPDPPTFNVLGTVAGPTGFDPAPTTPDVLQNVSWPHAFGEAFEYTVDPTRDVATAGGINDNAVLYFFGRDPANALSIGPDTSARTTAYLFLTEPGEDIPEPQPEPEAECVNLIAGQHIVAGEVCVINDGDNLSVTYTTSGGWMLTETHLHVSDDAEGVPQNRAGNPQVGHFDHATVHDPAVNTFTYMIPLPDLDAEPGGEVTVAAHAVVERENGDEIQVETAWGEGERFVDERGSWAMSFDYEVQ